jgi:hypothetical protein
VLTGKCIERDFVGPCHLDNAVHRFAHGKLGQRGHDIIRRDGLQKCRRQVDLAAFVCRLADCADELEELSRAQNRKGKGYVMPDAGGRLRVKQVAAGGFKELEYRLVLERRRIRNIDDDVGARERLGQSLARDRIDSSLRENLTLRGEYCSVPQMGDTRRSCALVPFWPIADEVASVSTAGTTPKAQKFVPALSSSLTLCPIRSTGVVF